MSFWLIKLSGFLGDPDPRPPNSPAPDCVFPPANVTPSTTISGSFPERTEVFPRTRI